METMQQGTPAIPPELMPSAEDLAQADQDVAIVMLSRGTTGSGIPYWAYVAVKPSKCIEFKQMKQGKQVYLSDYGTVLRMGYGSEPPAEVKRDLAELYGVSDDFEQQIIQAAREAQDAVLEEQAKLDQEVKELEERLRKKQLRDKYTAKKPLPDGGGNTN